MRKAVPQPGTYYMESIFFHKKEYLDTAVLTEAEIDSPTAITSGFPSLSVGGSNWSKEKQNLNLQTNIKILIIATDNDSAGEKLKRNIIEDLGSAMDLFDVRFPDGCKDLNEIGNIKVVEMCLKNKRLIIKKIIH